MREALYPSLKPLKVVKEKPAVEAPPFKGTVRAEDYERQQLVQGTWKKPTKAKSGA